MKLNLNALIVWSLFISTSCVAQRKNHDIQIKPDTSYDRFEGFGTSLAWFAVILGEWPESKRLEIANLLFSRDNGLGFNIVRYNIGGGDHPSHKHMRPGGTVPVFKDAESSPYHFDADPGQVWFLKTAISFGANIKEAFVNSPPWWMTRSQCSGGFHDPNEDNLARDRYPEFATYLADVVSHFDTALGIRFDSISAFNEPGTNYWKAFGRQEGSHYTAESQSKLIETLADTLQNRGITWIQLSANDETDLDLGINEFLSYSDNAKKAIHRINLHTYGGRDRVRARNIATEYKKRLWMSEVDGSGGMGYDPNHIKPGLELAHQISVDLNWLKPNAWVFWQAVEDRDNMKPERENMNWGLIHADFSGKTTDYYLTKKYYVMKQFSSHIRANSLRLDLGQEDFVGFMSEDGQEITLVLTNTSKNDQTVAINLPFRIDLKAQTSWRTSSSENHQAIEPPCKMGGIQTLDVYMPKESVTTLVLTLS